MSQSRYLLKPPKNPLQGPKGPAPSGGTWALNSASLNGGALASKEVSIQRNELMLVADNVKVDLRNLIGRVEGRTVWLETEGVILILECRDEAESAGLFGGLERWVVQADFEARFSQEGAIGDGSFAQVFRSRRLSQPGGMQFAVKRILKSSVSGERALRYLESEINFLRLLNHGNILRLVAVFDCQDSVKIVTELLAGGSLYSKLKANRIGEEELLRALIGLVEALQELQRFGLLHRDIKPQNVLFDSEGRAKLIDFGLCADLNDRSPDSLLHDRSGTLGYIAPEALQPQPPGSPTPLEIDWRHNSDVFSLGIVAYEALTGQNPFVLSNYKASLELNQKAAIDFSLLTCSPLTISLIAKMTEFSPSKRITLDQLAREIPKILESLRARPVPQRAPFANLLLNHNLTFHPNQSLQKPQASGPTLAPQVIFSPVLLPLTLNASVAPQENFARLQRFSNVVKSSGVKPWEGLPPTRNPRDENLRNGQAFFRN